MPRRGRRVHPRGDGGSSRGRPGWRRPPVPRGRPPATALEPTCYALPLSMLGIVYRTDKLRTRILRSRAGLTPGGRRRRVWAGTVRRAASLGSGTDDRADGGWVG